MADDLLDRSGRVLVLAWFWFVLHRVTRRPVMVSLSYISLDFNALLRPRAMHYNSLLNSTEPDSTIIILGLRITICDVTFFQQRVLCAFLFSYPMLILLGILHPDFDSMARWVEFGIDSLGPRSPSGNRILSSFFPAVLL